MPAENRWGFIALNVAALSTDDAVFDALDSLAFKLKNADNKAQAQAIVRVALREAVSKSDAVKDAIREVRRRVSEA